MSINTPFLDKRNADDIVTQVEDRLDDYGWHGREGGAGRALVRVFGRMCELVVNRLNQVPEKHFLSFLNHAGVDLLPPRPASAELTFTPAKDAASPIYVPAGTQVATVQTETEPEIVFETEQDIIVSSVELVKCITFDQVNYSDNTAKATGMESGSFPTFKGTQERKRLLYLGDDELFTFSDDASRKAAEITLSFKFEIPGNHVADGCWRLKWLYWDGTDWVSLKDADAEINDSTNKFSQNGNVLLANLPELTKTEEDGKSGLWIACELTDGTTRNHLPVLSSVKVSRQIDIPPTQITVDAALSAIQSGTAFVPLDPAGEFFLLGQRPVRLDTFYLRADEAFAKQGATIKLDVDLLGITEALTETETSKLDDLTVVWEYYNADGWTTLGVSKWKNVTSTRLNFDDTTFAFTANDSKYVTFIVPKEGDEDPLFQKTRVNDQQGYWLRVRVIAGSYDVPGRMQQVGSKYEWVEPRTFAPLIKELKVTYSAYSSKIEEKTVDSCHSQVDDIWQDCTPAFAAGQTFAPFCAAEEGPALYLGFQPAFPAGKWIELLLDVAETETGKASRQVFWEYRSGSRWTALRVSYGAQGMSKRGYLGFFAPRDHQSSTEFGQKAFWLRARPHLIPLAKAGNDQKISAQNEELTVTLDASDSRGFDRKSKIASYIWRLAPIANGGEDQKNVAEDDEVAVTLDASKSQAFDPENRIARHIWRLLSSTPPVAAAGEDVTVALANDEATVSLNASGSATSAGRQIVKYIWHEEKEEKRKEQANITISTPYLKVIRPNTVSALNAVTIKEEVLGSSDGKPGQSFTLRRSPVISGVQIAVREPDRPLDHELKQLQKELEKVERSAQALLPASGSGKGVWILWHEVSDFYASTPAGHHFTLDPISGEIRFGDGKRGKIPPVGIDNIKAIFYRAHNGVNGNVAAGAIAVLRNPSGDMANIKSVTNPEKGAGGSDAETLDEIKLRGPQRIKHRNRAVTIEDFAWLAREASGEVGQARCLPTRDDNGLPTAGWVTVVITPKSGVAKPMPSLALLRCVEAYLKNSALTNLKDIDQIYVKGPEYIEATVLAKVVPTEPEKTDEIKLAVLNRLETFLHPLKGGPERSGWELGRDVYLSEVYAEIEAVSGVDHVAGLRLFGSLQQYRISLKEEESGYRYLPFDLPTGSKVSTFDESIRLVLAEPVIRSGEKRKDENGKLKQLAVYGFKVGDKVTVVAADNSVIVKNLEIASISGDKNDHISFVASFDFSSGWNPGNALISSDQRLRLPLVENGITKTGGKVSGVTVSGFKAGDSLCIVAGSRRDPLLEFLPVDAVDLCYDRIKVPEGHLIYSGNHDIEMILE